MLLVYYYRELHVTIIISRSFCLLFVFLVRCLIDRGFCWRRLTLSVLFHLTASSRPGFPYSPFSSNALSSGAIAEPSPACVLVPPFGIFSSKLLTFRKIRLMALQAFFSVDLVTLTVLQIEDLPRWWTQWTNGLYRGPTQEKNYFAPGGNWTRIAQLRVRRSTSRPWVAPSLLC